jgi:hypothetical protein
MIDFLEFLFPLSFMSISPESREDPKVGQSFVQSAARQWQKGRLEGPLSGVFMAGRSGLQPHFHAASKTRGIRPVAQAVSCQLAPTINRFDSISASCFSLDPNRCCPRIVTTRAPQSDASSSADAEHRAQGARPRGNLASRSRPFRAD